MPAHSIKVGDILHAEWIHVPVLGITASAQSALDRTAKRKQYIEMWQTIKVIVHFVTDDGEMCVVQGVESVSWSEEVRSMCGSEAPCCCVISTKYLHSEAISQPPKYDAKEFFKQGDLVMWVLLEYLDTILPGQTFVPEGMTKRQSKIWTVKKVNLTTLQLYDPDTMKVELAPASDCICVSKSAKVQNVKNSAKKFENQCNS